MLEERKELLKKYIVACIFESKLAWSDLATLGIVEKFLKVVAQDARDVIKELKKEGTPVLARMAEGGVNKLVALGISRLENLFTGRRK